MLSVHELLNDYFKIAFIGILFPGSSNLFILSIMNKLDDGISSLDTCTNVDIDDFSRNFCAELSDNLSILNLNIRGVKTNFLLLKSFLSQLRVPIKVIILTETHMHDGIESLYHLNGYKRYSVNRTAFGGGIAAYVHFSLNVEINKTFTGIFNSHECLCMTLQCPGGINIDFYCIYRPPNTPLRSFVEYLDAIKTRRLRRRSVFLGDINSCPVRDINTSGYRSLETFFHSKHFSQMVFYPTYFSYDSRPSILDHIWSNLEFKSHCNVFKSAIADHIPVIICFDIETKLPDVQMQFRDFSLKNIRNFFEKFESEFFEFYHHLFSNDYSIEKRFELVDAWLISNCNHFFPQRSKTVSNKRFSSPWLTDSIIKLIRKKHSLFLQFKNKKITSQSYSAYCKGLKALIQLAESMYHRRRFFDLRSDMRKKWRHLNNLLGRGNQSTEVNNLLIDGVEISDQVEIGDSFSDFFSSIASKLQVLLPSPDEGFGLKIDRNPQSLMKFNQITEGEIIVSLNEVKNNSALSAIPSKFLKMFPNLFAKLLAPLFNDCINYSYYPNILKKATIVPIFKGGDRCQIGNYRPISLLPLINKIFESLLYSRLYDFFQEHKLISDNQFGYLRNRSTSQAVLKLIDHALPAINKKNYSLVTMVDLSKAFDCVSHRMLVAKLERYGVRGDALSLLSSYLQSRKQCVRVTNKLSTEFVDVDGGVPQGSVLGPFFYIVYANDLNNILTGIDIVNFADDIALCVNGDHLPDLVREMNCGLSTLSNWSRFNLLPINYGKTHAMVITNKKYDIPLPLRIDGQTIPILKKTVYLGLHIDDRLTFTPHKIGRASCRERV